MKTKTTRDGNVVRTLKAHYNRITKISVRLTMMTALSGDIVYAVVVRNLRTGRKYLFKTYGTIGRAFNLYKAAIA